MRSVIRAAIVLVVGAGAAWAQPADDKAFALEQLEESRAALVAATEGLTDAQWNFRESEERWSPAEIVEHLALSEDFFYEIITGKLLQTEKRAEPLPNAAEEDRQVVTMLADRSQRFDAPEPLQPDTSFASPQAAMEAFLAGRERIIGVLNDTPDLRLHVMEAPGGQERDGVQWLLFVAGHTIRHTAQLDEVKAAAEFPGT